MSSSSSSLTSTSTLSPVVPISSPSRSQPSLRALYTLPIMKWQTAQRTPQVIIEFFQNNPLHATTLKHRFLAWSVQQQLLLDPRVKQILSDAFGSLGHLFIYHPNVVNISHCTIDQKIELFELNLTMKHQNIIFEDLCKESLFIDKLTSFLFIAISTNNLATCQQLVKKYPDLLKQASETGDFPIHHAARFGTSEIVQFLLTQDPESIRRVNNEKTPLIHLAAAHGNLKVLEFLFSQNNEYIKQTTQEGALPIHIAAQRGSLETARFLAERWPASIKHTDQQNFLPIHYAAQSTGSLETVQFLEELWPESIKHTAQHRALPIHIAAKFGSLETVQFLVERWPESITHTSQGLIPLHYAVQSGSLETVQFLVKQWPESLEHTTQSGALPIHIAAQFGSLEIVQFLAKQWPESIKQTTQDGLLPLHYAAKFRSLDVVRFLVEQWPESIEQATSQGVLPIHIATTFSSLETVQFLVEQWPESIKQTTQGRGFLPIHLAAKHGPLEIVQFLANQWRESIQQPSHTNELLCHCGACNQNVEVLKFCVAQDPSSIMHRDQKGYLPLHHAAISLHLQNAQFLLQTQLACMRQIGPHGFEHAIDSFLSSEETTEAHERGIRSLIQLESAYPPQEGQEPIFHHNLSPDAFDRLLVEYKNFHKQCFSNMLLNLSTCSLTSLLTYIPHIRLHISNLKHNQEKIEVYKKLNFICLDTFFSQLIFEIMQQSNNTIDQKTLSSLTDALQIGLEWHHLTQGTYEMGGNGLNTRIEPLLNKINQRIASLNEEAGVSAFYSPRSQPQTTLSSPSTTSSSSSSTSAPPLQPTPLPRVLPPLQNTASPSPAYTQPMANASVPPLQPIQLSRTLPPLQNTASSSSSRTPAPLPSRIPGSAKRTDHVSSQKAADKRPRI